MITELEKKEIDKKYFPNGFYYKMKNFDTTSWANSKKYDEPFESVEEYESSVKALRIKNAFCFYQRIKDLNVNDFIKEINNQYLDYTIENKKNAKLWLSLTYDLVLKGVGITGFIEDVSLRGSFIEWYNLKVKELNVTPQEYEIKLFIENNFDHVPPKRVCSYFKKELVETGYLSIEDLEKYLIMAFQDEKIQDEKFRFEKRIKVKTARDIFYRYYTVISKAGNTKKKVYAGLLGNYFTGFTTQKVFDNFAK